MAALEAADGNKYVQEYLHRLSDIAYAADRSTVNVVTADAKLIESGRALGIRAAREEFFEHAARRKSELEEVLRRDRDAKAAERPRVDDGGEPETREEKKRPYHSQRPNGRIPTLPPMLIGGGEDNQ